MVDTFSFYPSSLIDHPLKVSHSKNLESGKHAYRNIICTADGDKVTHMVAQIWWFEDDEAALIDRF